jgi:hypothetical protein
MPDTVGVAPGTLMITPPTTSEVRSPTSTSSDVRSPTSTDVRSPTSTSTEVRSPTSTSTDAYTQGNITVTGGAGAGATTSVNVFTHPTKAQKRADRKANEMRSKALANLTEQMMASLTASRAGLPRHHLGLAGAGCPGLGCPEDPPNHYVFDPITGSANNDVGFPGDHAVGYYPGSLGDGSAGSGTETGSSPMTLFGVRLDILGVVAGAAVLGAILFGKYVAK